MFPVFAAKQREKKKTESSLPRLSFVLVNAAVCHETPNRIVMSVFDWNFQPKGKQRPPPHPPHRRHRHRQIHRFVPRNTDVARTNNIFSVQKCDLSKGHSLPGFTSDCARSTSSSSTCQGDEFLCSSKLLSPAILAISAIAGNRTSVEQRRRRASVLLSPAASY